MIKKKDEGYFAYRGNSHSTTAIGSYGTLPEVIGNQSVLQLMFNEDALQEDAQAEEVTELRHQAVVAIVETYNIFLETEPSEWIQDTINELNIIIHTDVNRTEIFNEEELVGFGEFWRMIEYAIAESELRYYQIGIQLLYTWGRSLCVGTNEDLIDRFVPLCQEIEAEDVKLCMSMLDGQEEAMASAYMEELVEAVNSMERPPFCDQLLEVMPTDKGQHRCHRISYAYIRSGCMSPILECLRGVIRVMGYYETDLPQYASTEHLHHTLLGILYAVFPLQVLDDSGDLTEEQCALSMVLFSEANELIGTILELYNDFCHAMLGHTLPRFDIDFANELISMCKNLVAILNSSPENLRPGDGGTNESIHEALDIPIEDVKTSQISPELCAGIIGELSMGGGFDSEDVLEIIDGSPSHIAMLFLLLFADTGDTSIDVFSGTIVETDQEEQRRRETVQTSSVSGLYASTMECGSRDVTFALSPSEQPSDWPEGLELPETDLTHFRFTRDLAYVSKARQHITAPPLSIETRASTRKQKKEQEYRDHLHKNLIENYEDVCKAFEEDLGHSLCDPGSEDSNCLFAALAHQLNRYNIQVEPDEFINRLRLAANQPEGMVQLEGGLGTQNLVMALAKYIGQDVTLVVHEPYGVDDNGFYLFREQAYQSNSAVPGIELHIYFNGVNHFLSVI